MEKYQNTVQSCLATIKNQVKLQKITYREIAEKLGVSELTVKRQINGKDISMSKLLALCDAAGIDFADAWDSQNDLKPKHSLFSKEQDAAFFTNPNLMSFFFEMYDRGKAPAEIRKEHDLTSASLHLYLRKLEHLGLIQVSAQQNIHFKIKAPIGFSSDSKVLMRELSEVLRDLDAALTEGKEFDRYFISKPFQLSEELKAKMFEELVEIVSRYAELSEKYFSQSNHEKFEFIAVEYKQPARSKIARIKNLTAFD